MLNRDAEADGWWFGLIGESYGYFPANHAELIDGLGQPPPPAGHVGALGVVWAD